MHERPTDGLVVRARSEPDGITIEWKTALDGDELRQACDAVTLFLTRLRTTPRRMAHRPFEDLPPGHPHRDEMAPPPLPPANSGLRFAWFDVGFSDASSGPGPHEPTAAERAAGARIGDAAGPPWPRQRRCRVRHFSSGAGHPELQLTGPEVEASELYDAILAEVARRRP